MKRRLVLILTVLSLLVCVVTAILWMRSYWKTDTLTFVAGGSFCDCIANPDGISIRWLTSLPAGEMPLEGSRGWRTCASTRSLLRNTRQRPDGPFINIPEATRRFHRLGGIEVFWGSGQILQPVWFIYKKTPLVPLRGISITWSALLICSMVIPGARLVRWAWAAWLQRKRRRQGLCTTCGYDLRASKDRCPECGTPK